MMSKMDKKQQVLIIGASRGIGKALALKFANNNDFHVLALSRNLEAMSDLKIHANISTFHFDLSAQSVKQDLSEILSKIESLDFVINNAGKLVNKPFLDLTDEDFYACYDTNAIGVMKAMQVVVPKMIKKGGHIVNISTMGAFQGSVKFPGLSAYSTSKAAITSFTELFSEEFKETKIRMNCLCLGAVQTEMLQEAFPGFEAPVKPEEMANYIFEFTNNAHKFMNGKILPLSLTTP